MQLQDPSIKQLAEQIATDPTFKDMTEQLQKSMTGMFGGAEGAPPAAANPEEAARNFDPSQYMQAMNSMFQNQKFLEMAESLGKAIIGVSTAVTSHSMVTPDVSGQLHQPVPSASFRAG